MEQTLPYSGMMRYITLFVLLACLAASCSIDKRLYRNGYYIHKNRAIVRGEKLESRVDTLCSVRVERAIYSTVDSIASNDVKPEEKISPLDLKSTQVTISETPAPEQSLTPAPDVVTEEEPVREVKRNDQWKSAGLAVLSAVLGILLGAALASVYTATWFLVIFSLLVLGAVIFFIYRSIRDHVRYMRLHPEGEAQPALAWAGRIALYLLALAGALFVAIVALAVIALNAWK